MYQRVLCNKLIKVSKVSHCNISTGKSLMSILFYINVFLCDVAIVISYV